MSSLREISPVRDGRPHVVALKPASPREGHWRGGASLETRRMISLVAALGLMAPIFRAWDDVVAVPSAGIAVVALFAGVLCMVSAIAIARTEARLDRLEVWLLVLGLLALLAWTAAQLSAQGGYGTDEAAFEQGAANLLLHGHDPYGANLLTALAGFSTPAQFATHTMDGGIVSTYGYPAFPLLIIAPLVALTGNGQAVPIADMLVLMLATVLLFKQLPAGWRSIAVVLCVGFPTLSGFSLAGVNSIMAMALLLVPAYRWTSTAESGVLGRRDRIAAACLGLALATNQLAWFVAPFLVVGIYLVRQASHGTRPALRVVLRYVGLALGVFGLVNAPFILWGPSAWLHGVTAPLLQHAIPYGQGLVDLTLFLRIGGGAMDAYNYAAALLYAALLAVYVIRFRRLGRACFLLPLLALFVSGRSLGEYWLTMIAVIAIGSLSADPGVIASVRPRFELRRFSEAGGSLAVAGLFLPAAVWLGIALATPQPLTLRILSGRSDPSVHLVRELRVLARNGSSKSLRPHFATNVTGQAVLWNIRRGPHILRPGRTAVYELLAPDTASMPPNGTRFVLEAFTATPRTVSTSQSFVQRGVLPGSW